ncbi:MAG: glycine cleavage system aminomethyltransferase GcvT [Saprospiraceae bacterium]|nr:glycine cleavage system aminomethyltransferase GcvT [Saprospiraceae bacterium]MBK7737893.1 glycine cleavage system aminomethyltransferase GcvT [Saprospiraceae bacterium]MBK7913528.1 glycine cleavage system aminomethyltransferase GcvT [Saprospiraceae bacterium]
MKNTALTEVHIGLGAKMAEFAGYNMPISYAGIREEHEAVRNHVGVFDVSHMGEFIIRGKHALDLIQKVTSNDASKLKIGQAQYSCMPNGTGGIVDDLLVYRLAESMGDAGEPAYMLVVNASNIQKDWDWISKHNSYGATMLNISDETGLLAVQGPKAIELLQKLTSVDLSAIPYYHFQKGTLAGIDNVLISATGYTGAGGFELYVDNKHLLHLWNEIFKIGNDYKLQAVGLGARDTLRLEMGFCLYGNDIDDTTSPLEAGLGWITKLDKADFNGKQLMLDQKKNGLQKKLVGFIIEDRRVPRHGYRVINVNEEVIGVVTSGTQSPSLNIPIGMAYVPIAYTKEGTQIKVEMGSKSVNAKVCKIPFYKAN